MIKKWEDGAEVVLARRTDRNSDTFLKRSSAKLFYQMYNWVADVELPANVGDFRLMDRTVVDALKQLPNAKGS